MVFIQIIKNIFVRSNKTSFPRHLGRWNINDNINHTQLKIDYANIDSCGDRLCALPQYLKKNKINKK